MKRIYHIITFLSLWATLLTSCSGNRQLYSYRKTVSPDKQIHPVKQARESEDGRNNRVESALPEAGLQHSNIEPAAIAGAADKAQVNNEAPAMARSEAKAAHESNRMISVKAAKQQIKALKKELKRSESAADINGRRWMVIGAILLVVGVIIAVFPAPLFYLGSALASVGFVVFVIGLVFYLVDNVT